MRLAKPENRMNNKNFLLPISYFLLFQFFLIIYIS